MKSETKLSGLAKYAWFVLAYNLIVIIWGVFLRASKSGDGCGQHWLTCNGEVVPSAPQLKTVIEFSHRITSALDGIFLIALVVWAFAAWYFSKSRENRVLKAAVGSFVFVVIEGLLGAGLVLTGNTAETLTAARPFWMAAHLVNTLILLAFLSLTAWFASGGKTFSVRGVPPKVLIFAAIGVAGVFLVGMSGSVAALSSMLFPSETLSEGLAKDFSQTSHILLRLRVSHPILSVSIGVFLVFFAGWLKGKSANNAEVSRWSNILMLLVLIQFASGAVTLLTLAPIVMQIVHLFLADAVWIAFVLMTAAFLAAQKAERTADNAKLINRFETVSGS